MSKHLTETQVRDVLAMLQSGLGVSEIARKLGKSRQAISDIKCGKKWKNLTLPQKTP